MEYVVLFTALAAALFASLFSFFMAKKRTTSSYDVVARLDKQDALLNELKTKFELGDRGQDFIREELVRTGRTLLAMQADFEARRRSEEESRLIVKRLESVIAGSYAKGRAGENILREAFKHFPAEMVEADFQVGGRVVEFGLKLYDGKVLPLDSKWPATSLALALDAEEDEARRRSIIADVEREVGKKVREAAGYIDPAKTVPWAVVALPDSIFSVCKRAFIEAHKARVLLMSYSMAVPYLLTFYSLHLQYSRSIDLDAVESHLAQIERQLDLAEQVIENRLARGSTMVNNAYVELGQITGRIRGSLGALKSLEPATDTGEADEPVECFADTI